MSQEQGTKLEGLFTSVQMHAASIDETLDGFMDTFGQLCDTIGKILEMSSRCRRWPKIYMNCVRTE